MEDFARDLLLLAAGALLALISSLLTTLLAARAKRREALEAREAEAEDSRRVVRMDRAEAALQLMDSLFAAMTETPGSNEGYEWEFDHSSIRRLEDAVLLIPDADVRDRVRDGLNLLGGWHTLMHWGGDVVEDLPYVLQRKSLRYMREILGACVRGDNALPEGAEKYLRENAEALERAWEHRIAEEAGHR
jgi:hypothetical protein